VDGRRVRPAQRLVELAMQEDAVGPRRREDRAAGQGSPVAVMGEDVEAAEVALALRDAAEPLVQLGLARADFRVGEAAEDLVRRVPVLREAAEQPPCVVCGGFGGLAPPPAARCSRCRARSASR